MNNFLNLDMSTGRLFEYSKDPKDGFVEHIYENKKDNTVKTSYRKWYDEGAFGYLKSLCTTEKKLGAVNALHLRIVLQDAEENNLIIDFPMKNIKGQWNDFTVSVLMRLQFLQEDVCYRFFPYVLEDEKKVDKKGKPRKSYGIAINFARLTPTIGVDKKNKVQALTRTYTKKEEDGTLTLVPGDVPAVQWVEGVDDKMAMETRERDVYLWNVLKEHKIKSDFKLGGGKVAEFDSKEEPVAKAAPAGTVVQKTPEQPTTNTASTPASTGKNAMERARPAETPVATNVSSTPAANSDEEDDLPF